MTCVVVGVGGLVGVGWGGEGWSWCVFLVGTNGEKTQNFAHGAFMGSKLLSLQSCCVGLIVKTVQYCYCRAQYITMHNNPPHVSHTSLNLFVSCPSQPRTYSYSLSPFMCQSLFHFPSRTILLWCTHTRSHLSLFSLSLSAKVIYSLSLFLPIPLCLFYPHRQSERTGSIVIGLQSWQPYDWAVGYCNWIRLEISSVPVRLLKAQSVVRERRQYLAPPFALFLATGKGNWLRALV